MTTALIWCLSITSLGGTNHMPAPIVEIVQNHIIQELHKTQPNLLVNFGAATCPNVIHYEEGVSSLKLVGNSSAWSGEKQIAYTDALAQRPISFDENLLASPPIAREASESKKIQWKPWLIWMGVGLVTSAIIYRQVQSPKSKSDHPQTTSLRTGLTF